MEDAHRPALEAHTSEATTGSGRSASRYELLAGDLHCHINPPDRMPHVSRGLPETVELARAENLDFVVLTPHLRAPFFLSEWSRDNAVAGLAELKRQLSEQDLGDMIFIVGFEYTDFSYGHVGAAFADLEKVFAAVPVEEAQARPGRFFEAYVEQGGMLILNHPLLTPLDSAIRITRVDMSWQPFTGPGPYPEEIRTADRLAQGVEVFNLAIAELRDRFLLFDPDATLHATLKRLDREILVRGRPMIPVGGSDSHSGHLRATTFVLSEHRTQAGIHEALLAGRLCVRDPAGCSFEVRAPGGPWLPPGSSVKGVEWIQARARGHSIRFVVNGSEIEPAMGIREITIPLEKGRCSVIRAAVDHGYSAPIYANCPF
jgi:predicted metal-dependent phosphoesterase TrpH